MRPYQLFVKLGEGVQTLFLELIATGTDKLGTNMRPRFCRVHRNEIGVGRDMKYCDPDWMRAYSRNSSEAPPQADET